MTYILKHNNWFSNRPTYTINRFGISPSSKFIYKENEVESYSKSPSLMSQALIYVADQVTKKTAQLVAKKNSDSSYTDGKHIVVGMNPIKESKDLFNGMDIEMGLACHEACHCAFTDFKDYSLQKCKYPIAHWLHNVYEDECIEEMLGLRQPQWMYFLDNVLSHYFNKDKFIDSMKKLIMSNSKIDIVQFMILYMVRESSLANRFPKDWIDEFGPMLDELYDKVICHIEDPKIYRYSPTKETSKAVLDSIEIIKKYVSLDELSSKLHKPHLGMIGNSSSEGNPNQDKNCGLNGLFAPNDKASRSKSEKTITSRYDNASKESNIDKMKIKNDPKVDMFNNATKEIGALKPNNKDAVAYKNTISKLREEINIAKRIIIPNEKKIDLEDDNFHRNGQLINSHLVQAIQGVNCVYHRKVTKTSDSNDPKYVFVIALDESGSMGYNWEDNTPANIASKISMIFYEAMKNYPGIELYVYGHGDNVVKYISPKDKVPYRLATRHNQGFQNESLSYDTILKDVRLHTNKKIFFLNVTDSLYLQKKNKISATIDNWKSNNVFFGLLSICPKGNIYDKLIKETNDSLYEDRWVEIHDSDNGLKEALKKFSKIIRKNYDMFKRIK